MARHKKSIVQDEGNPELDISSLIDVCFLLLIYFIVTSTITPREQDLGMWPKLGGRNIPDDSDEIGVGLFGAGLG